MKLFTTEDLRDLVTLFSVPSAGIFIYYLHKFISWSAGVDYNSSCGRGLAEGVRCEPGFLEIAVDLLDIWAVAVSVTVLPLLALVIFLVIIVRWIRSLVEPAAKH